MHEKNFTSNPSVIQSNQNSCELDQQVDLPLQTCSAIEILKKVQRHVAVLMLIILLDPKPVGESIISGILGINRKTARSHLKALSQLNCIARSGYFGGFILTQGGRQLILPVDSSLGTNAPSLGKNDPVVLPSSATYLNKKEHSYQAAEAEELGKNAPSLGKNDPVAKEIDNLLITLGIGQNKRDAIKVLPYLTPESIKRKVEDLSRRGKYSTGLLIYALLNDPPPIQTEGATPKYESVAAEIAAELSQERSRNSERGRQRYGEWEE